MPPTSAERTRLRLEIGDPGGANETFSDAELDIFWAAAEALYTSAAAIYARAKLTAIETMLFNSAKLVTYTQNASSESLSDVSRNLRELHKIAQDELERIQSITEKPSARWGAIRNKPTKVRSFPGS